MWVASQLGHSRDIIVLSEILIFKIFAMGSVINKQGRIEGFPVRGGFVNNGGSKRRSAGPLEWQGIATRSRNGISPADNVSKTE